MRGPTPVPETSIVSPASTLTVISSVKSCEELAAVSMRSIPRSSATPRALTRLTGSSVCPERDAHERRDPEQADLVVGERAAHLDLDPGDRAVAEPRREAAELR